MRKQGSEYLTSYLKLWKFLVYLEEKGWKLSKTQYFLNKEVIIDSKIASTELLSEIYQIDSEKYLRYDLTVPWKTYLQAKTNQPSKIKRYEIGEVFRKGPRKGKRFRNFTQLDLEICSKTSYFTNELLKDFFQLFSSFSKRLVLKYNNYQYFSELSFEQKQEIDFHFSKNKLASSETLMKFEKILEEIKEKTIVPKIETSFNNQFEPSLMRGQGIYTRFVFQGYLENQPSSLFAGGQYKIGDYFCTGVSVGVDFLSMLF
jgi:histidyl-tRNA synthetase